jgi:hypothetical protein
MVIWQRRAIDGEPAETAPSGSQKDFSEDFVQIPVHRGQSFRRIADSVPVIADSFR